MAISTFINTTASNTAYVLVKASQVIYDNRDRIDQFGQACDRAWERQMSAARSFVGFIFSVAEMIQASDAVESVEQPVQLASVEEFAQEMDEHFEQDAAAPEAHDITIQDLDAFDEQYGAVSPVEDDDLDITVDDLQAIESVEARESAAQPQVFATVNFGRMSLKELKAYAERNRIGRDRVREYGRLTARNTWEEALVAITAVA